MHIRLHVKYSFFMSDFNEHEFSGLVFRKIFKYQSNENPSSWGRVVSSGRTDMTKLIVAFLNFAKTLKNVVHAFR
jgi:hypothetical protein